MSSTDVSIDDAFAVWTQTHRDLVSMQSACACCEIDPTANSRSTCCGRRGLLEQRANAELSYALSLIAPGADRRRKSSSR